MSVTLATCHSSHLGPAPLLAQPAWSLEYKLIHSPFQYHCSGSFFCCWDKTPWSKAPCVGLFQFRVIIKELKHHRNRKTGMSAEPTMECCLLAYWLALHGLLAQLSHTSQDHLPTVTSSTVSWVLLHQPSRKYHPPLRLSTNQSDGSIFSVGVPSSPRTLALVKAQTSRSS